MSLSREASVRHPSLRSAIPAGRFATPRACNDNVPIRSEGRGRTRAGTGLGVGVLVVSAWAALLAWVVYQIALWAGF